MNMTPEQIKAAAIKLCELRGKDPYSNVIVESPSCYGCEISRHELWEDAAIEITDFYHKIEAIEFALEINQ